MGSFVFKYGNMNASKTADLLMNAYSCREKNFEVFLIKPKIDTRNGTKIKSRIGLEAQAIILNDNQSFFDLFEVNNINKEPTNLTYIFIDEAQFLNKEQVKELFYLSKNKYMNIICYGLRLNYLNEGFEGSRELLTYVDKIEEIKTICVCGNKAITHLLKVNGQYTFRGEGIHIGDTEFESVCFNCYDKVFTEKLFSEETYELP